MINDLHHNDVMRIVLRAAYTRLMSDPKTTRKRRSRGSITTLPSGSLRVSVYVGEDPLTGKRVYNTETIPPGPDAYKEAERVRTRILNEIDERRAARSKATVNKLMDHYLAKIDVDVTTKSSYESYIRNHIRPLLGREQVGKLDGELLDSFFLTLRTCREHCNGRPHIRHRTTAPHECDSKCKPHKCRPLATSSIRQIHGCLSGALSRAIRWRWIAVNPLDQAEPPRTVKPKPNPPTADQAAAIINRSFKDMSWGMLVWLAMTTGARRGEICALRWNLLDLDKGVLSIKTSIGQSGSKTWEKDTKDHQQRRITLDPPTVTLLRAYRKKREEEAKSVGARIARDGRIFSPDVEHMNWLKPSTVTQRYARMCKSLGWEMNIHQLRHYSATELISGGVDIRTVAGRLGHGGGGSTTLRVYTAWVSEADQRAAGTIHNHMPAPPIEFEDGEPIALHVDPDLNKAYEKIAADLRGAIMAGIIPVGGTMPTTTFLAKRYDVAPSTAHRAIELLKQERLVKSGGKGKPVVVIDRPPTRTPAKVVNLDTKRKAN